MLATLFADGGALLMHILVATSFVCIGFALTNPTLSAASSAASRRDEMGGALGLVQGFGSLGQVIGLTAAGPLYLSGGAGLSFSFDFRNQFLETYTFVWLEFLDCLV